MNARVGDRLVEEGRHVGDHRRIGVITAVEHDDGTPPYTVRWLDSGHEALVYPGSDAHIEPSSPDAAEKPNRDDGPPGTGDGQH